MLGHCIGFGPKLTEKEDCLLDLRHLHCIQVHQHLTLPDQRTPVWHAQASRASMTADGYRLMHM